MRTSLSLLNLEWQVKDNSSFKLLLLLLRKSLQAKQGKLKVKVLPFPIPSEEKVS
jgi:hypothetical protein